MSKLWASINHSEHKLAIPSRNYNATVTHSHQILGTTCGHPGTWNDKTLIMYDELIRGVNTRKMYLNYLNLTKTKMKYKLHTKVPGL